MFAVRSRCVYSRKGLTYAFANIYRSFMSAVRDLKNGTEPTDLDFPTVGDGVMGVRFVHAVVKSSKNNSVWTEV